MLDQIFFLTLSTVRPSDVDSVSQFTTSEIFPISEQLYHTLLEVHSDPERLSEMETFGMIPPSDPVHTYSISMPCGRVVSMRDPVIPA